MRHSCITSTSELKMLRLWGVFVLCSSLVQAGFVNFRRDHVVDDDPGEGGSDLYEATDLEPKAGFGDEKDFGRDLLSGSKDMVVPLLTGVIVKVLTLLPLILTTLAVIAGFSLAASKVALLLGGGLMLYHYISETQFLLPVSNKGGAVYSEPASFHPSELFSHPELSEYTRDRILNLNSSVDT